MWNENFVFWLLQRPTAGVTPTDNVTLIVARANMLSSPLCPFEFQILYQSKQTIEALLDF